MRTYVLFNPEQKERATGTIVRIKIETKEPNEESNVRVLTKEAKR